MTLKTKQRLETLSIIIGGIGLLMFMGYLLKLNYYSSLSYPWSIPIQLNSSINLILSCFSLHFLINKKNRAFIKYCSILLIINGLINLFYLLHLDSDVLNSIYLNPIFDSIIIERYTNIKPCLASVFCYIVIGLSFLGILSKSKFFNQTAQAALHLVTLIAFLTILSLSDNIPSLEDLYFFSNFSIYGASMLLLLSIMTATVQPHLGFVTIFLGSKIGHTLSRSLFPKIIISVLILGYLRVEISKTNLINEASANVLLQASFILITLFIAHFTKENLNKIDDQRKKAEYKTLLANKNLEKRIAIRTNNLTKQNKQLEEFAYVVSHNFRAPVSNLHSLIDIYKEEEDLETKELLIEKFEITVTNLTTTLNDLLSVISVKNDSKKEKQNLLLDTYLLNAIDSLQEDIVKSDAQVTSDFSKAPGLEYSAVYLDSIIQNLLSNALKYSSPLRTAKVHFQSHTRNDKTVLTVCDNGLGIDLKEHGKEIFGFNKVFHKHPNAKGVGLFLTKAQVEGMGGTITVESTVDVGTKFEIIF
jgi:signal transduction histidine kinase